MTWFPVKKQDLFFYPRPTFSSKELWVTQTVTLTSAESPPAGAGALQVQRIFNLLTVVEITAEDTGTPWQPIREEEER